MPEPYEIIEISPENLKSLPGKFAVDSDHMLTIKKENNQLYAPLTFSDKAEIFPISETKFIRRDQRVVYEFVKDPETKPQRPCAGRHAFTGPGGTIDH